MNKYIKPSEYAKYMSISKKTVYTKFKQGKIPGYQDEDTGTIFIENPEFHNNQQTNQNQSNSVVLYARVSSSQNEDRLDTQLDRLRMYAYAKGYKVIAEYKEIGSGLNDDRKKLNEIMNKNDFSTIIVEHKDRLTCFDFNYLEKYFNNKNQKIEVINESTNTQDDLMEDFVSIITSFCARLNGKKPSQRKIEKIINELKVKSYD